LVIRAGGDSGDPGAYSLQWLVHRVAADFADDKGLEAWFSCRALPGIGFRGWESSGPGTARCGGVAGD